MEIKYNNARKSAPIPWWKFKSEIRKVDRESLLEQAAHASALIEQDLAPEQWLPLGVTPWTIAGVARTALAWGESRRRKADLATLIHLCNMHVNITDEDPSAIGDPHDRVSRMLTRSFFEQFTGQRTVEWEIARTLLLFGVQMQTPDGFDPEAMKPGWFETVTGGITLNEYVESVFVLYALALQGGGSISKGMLDAANLDELEGVISTTALRSTFDDLMTGSLRDFKISNRRSQEDKPDSVKKYTFNPLEAKPFVLDATAEPIAPSLQYVIARAFPPAIYHLSRNVYQDAFTRDLGQVFQEYTGRQLGQIEGQRAVISEVKYGPRKNRLDSSDWFLDLPGLLVLIECKSRQPVEPLRTRDHNWLDSVNGSINKAISQLGRSNTNIDEIAQVWGKIDSSKPRIGLVVTLEPFYINQNWHMWDELEKSDFPVGVISVGELESLVLLSAGELETSLLDAVDSSEVATDRAGLLLLHDPLKATLGRENELLSRTLESLNLFRRINLAGS